MTVMARGGEAILQALSKILHVKKYAAKDDSDCEGMKRHIRNALRAPYCSAQAQLDAIQSNTMA